MASLTELREGLAANLAGITGLNESAYVLSNPTMPHADVMPAEIEYDKAMSRGLDYWTLTVRVFVGLVTDKGAQKRLDLMLASSGTESVKTALESDCTLGGAADDLQVTRCTGYRTYLREGGGAALGAEWTVQVFASGD